MALNMPVFYKRTASAIVFAIIMLTGLLWRIEAFYALFILISVLCLQEYFRLMQKIDTRVYWPLWLQVVTICMNVVLIGYVITVKSNLIAGFNMPGAGMLILAIVALLFFGCILLGRNAMPALMMSLGGLFYITSPVLAIVSMRWVSMELPIALILMIWINDTMAYLVGSFIGKTPFSTISPKKTWEGTAGGAILTIIGAMAYGYFSHKFRLVDWAVLALCAGVAGTLGDLVESKLKRMADIKDSGKIMPGHGGALDRFDSLLLAAPFAGAYVALFM